FPSSCSGFGCSFTYTSSDPDGSIASCICTCGDEPTALPPFPTRRSSDLGTYSVKLTVTDNAGATGTVTHSVTVSAPNQAPTAAFTRNCTGLDSRFVDQSSAADGSIESRSWTFGDGATSTSQNPSHSYSAG